MRFMSTCAVLFSFCAAVPAFSQNTVLVAAAAANAPANAPTSAPAATSTAPAAQTQAQAPAASHAPVDLTGFKESIAQKNKSLNDQVASERAIVKKNAIILEDAKRIDIANKKLETQRKQLEAQNAELDKERQQIMAEEKAAGN